VNYIESTRPLDYIFLSSSFFSHFFHYFDYKARCHLFERLVWILVHWWNLFWNRAFWILKWKFIFGSARCLISHQLRHRTMKFFLLSYLLLHQIFFYILLALIWNLYPLSAVFHSCNAKFWYNLWFCPQDSFCILVCLYKAWSIFFAKLLINLD